jgi:hypothetical protein
MIRKFLGLFFLVFFISISFVSALDHFLVVSNLDSGKVEVRNTFGNIHWASDKSLAKLNSFSPAQDRSVVVDDKGAVYFFHDANLSKYDFFGDVQWNMEVGSTLNMRVVGGSVFVSSSSMVREFNRTSGALINQFDLSTNALGTSLAVFDESADYVYYSTGNEMAMYDFRNNLLVKTFPRIVSYSFPAAAVVHDGAIYVTSYGNNIKKLDIDSGLIEWVSFAGGHSFDRFSSVYVDPVTSDVYFALYREAGLSYPDHKTRFFKVRRDAAVSSYGYWMTPVVNWSFFGYELVVPYSNFRPSLIVLDGEGRLYTRARETSIVLNSVTGEELFRVPNLVYVSSFSIDQSEPVVFSISVSGSLRANSVVVFDASNSYSIYVDYLSFEWYLDDVLIGSGPILNYVFESRGDYDLVLKVNDGVSGVYEEEISVSISAPAVGGGGGVVVEDSRAEVIIDDEVIEGGERSISLSAIQESFSLLSSEVKFLLFVVLASGAYYLLSSSKKSVRRGKRVKRRKRR